MSTITLDYDDVTYEYVKGQIQAMVEREKALIGFVAVRITQSSSRHFHAKILTRQDVPFDVQVAIAERSGCSQEYVRRVRELGYFTIRTTHKSDGTPAPRET